MKHFVKTCVGAVIALIFGVIEYFIFLPSLSLASGGFWWLLFFSLLPATIIIGLWESFEDEDLPVVTGIYGIGTVLTLAIVLFGGLGGTSPFHAEKASQQLKVVEVTSYEEMVSAKTLEEVENTFPKIDQASAEVIANRKLGELVDLVSQFGVDKYCTLINYNGKPYRVSPLMYNSWYKYLKNKENGIPGYVLIDLVTKDAQFIELSEGMQYSPSACFSKDLTRKIKKDYPSAILGDYSFEIDDNGVPYWIIPDLKVTSGIGGLKTNQGCFTVNAQTGEIARYATEEIPSWVDRALDTDIIIHQINNWGTLVNGFWNSMIGQKGVKVSTELYNFITEDDDVYLYTGITSAKADDKSNLGFMTVNMRSGDAKFVTISSADEESAKESAQGKVQEKGYVATDPIILNLNGIPTYALSLKDEGGLVKMYAFVSVEDYQKVEVAEESDGIKAALDNYMKYFNKEETKHPEPQEIKEENITVEQIEKAEVNGNSTYYIVSNGNVYVADIFSGGGTYTEGTPYFSYLPTVKVGDSVTVQYVQKDGYREVIKISSPKCHS